MSTGNISFFTPVVFEQDRTLGKYLCEKVDGYFSLCGKRAYVISGIKTDQSYDVQMKDYQSSAISKLILTVLKIVSYFTLVLPIFMLFTKVALRVNYSFNLIEAKPLLFSSPVLSSNFKEKIVLNGKDIFVFGDIHGELDGFTDYLNEAKIIDAEGNWAQDNASIAVQMGDVIDRGPKSLKAYEYLGKLQEQAEANGGKFIRLLGNHEEMILLENYHYAMASGLSLKQCMQLRERIINDIKSNKVTLSWTDGERLYVHGGERSIIREKLRNEILAKRRGFFGLGIKGDEVTFEDVVAHLNAILKKAVNSDDFSHDVFKVGKSRGGDSPYGGILWADASEILNSMHARDVPQVIAHSPPKRPTDQPIRITSSKRLVNVDAGLCKAFGNNHAFVQFHDNKILIHEKVRSFTNLFLSKRWVVREVS